MDEVFGRVDAEMRDGIAVLRIDNPPVNAGSHGVRLGLVEGLAAAAEAGASGVVMGAVIIGAGRCFVAGADLREFGQPLQTPELPDVIAAIEAAPFPVVAALHGVALGGGLELALGCDYRLAAPGTKLGLPEVSLGIVPGAGGTQRLPRLVGVATAMEMVCSGSRISAERALQIGLVDRLAEGDLLAAAEGFLRGAERPKRRAMGLVAPDEPEDEIAAVEARALRRGKGRPNVAEAIRLVRLAGGGDVAGTEALADERAAFQRLRLSDDAFALRYIFFAERKAGAVAGMDGNSARAVASIGVIGGGTMGQGIARTCLAAGYPVRLVERSEAAFEAAVAAIGADLQAQVAKGRLTAGEAAARLDRLAGGAGLEAVAGCDLVIEAVFEDMAVKAALLGDLEAVVAPDAILATNTSYLDINEMAAALARPERVLGLHFFSPADVMKLLEVVQGAATAPEVLATGFGLAKTLGKQPVLAQVCEGFIGNRMYAAYRRRAELLVLDGATPEAVDAAAEAFGFAMGPFLVSDLAGLDIAWAMRKRQAASRDPAARYVTIADSLCEAGRFGRKTGRGWYDYRSGRAAPDPEVAEVIAAARAEAGVVPVAMDGRTIQWQLMAAIVNEAACLLEEGVAERASDVDVVLVNGYGFPRWRGGPLYWAARQERAVLEAELAALGRAVGTGFVAGPVGAALEGTGGAGFT